MEGEQVDVVSRNPQRVYLKMHMPAELFDELREQRGSNGRACLLLREEWEKLLRRLRDETPRRVL